MPRARARGAVQSAADRDVVHERIEQRDLERIQASGRLALGDTAGAASQLEELRAGIGNAQQRAQATRRLAGLYRARGRRGGRPFAPSAFGT